MAALTVQNTGLGTSALEPTYAAASAGGDTFVNGDGRVILHVKNGSGASIDVTITTPYSLRGGIAVDDPVTAVPAGEDRMIGPFDPAVFNAAAGTGVSVSYSAATSVTVAAIRLQRLF